jgi:hypothetical protein
MLLGDATDSLQWAVSHVGGAVWLIAVLGGVVSWVAKRQKAALARQTALARRALQPSAVVAAAPAASPQNAPAPTAPAPAQPRAVFVRPGAARAGVAPGDPLPADLSSPVLRGAFADSAHARTAVILAEVLAPPVALR